MNLNSDDESGDSKTVDLVTRAVLLGMLCGICSSLSLWLTGARDYPLVPAFEWWPGIGKPLDLVLPSILAIAATIRLFTGRVRWLSALAIAAAILLALGDQTRWQPWLYQYIVMLAVLSMKDKPCPNDALDGCRIVVAFTYFWGGVQKLNAGFCTTVVPWLFSVNTADTYLVGIPCALIESALGLALLFSSSRRVSVILIVLMHFKIIDLLQHQNWNSVVWPWNLVMPILVFLLFWKKPQGSIKSILSPGKSPAKIAALVLFGFLPALNFIGVWDSYLSLALYSGNTMQANLELSELQYNKLPEKLKVFAVPAGNQKYDLSLLDWSMKDLNSAPYPELRVFRKVAQHVLQITGGDSITLVLTRFPRFFEPIKSIPWIEREEVVRH